MQHGNVVVKYAVGFPVAILHTSPDSLLGSMLSLLHRKSSIPVTRSHIKLIKQQKGVEKTQGFSAIAVPVAFTCMLDGVNSAAVVPSSGST